MVENRDLAAPSESGGFPEEFKGGDSFIRYKMDKDRGLFINHVTGAEKTALYVRIVEVHIERAKLVDGSLICSSNDKVYSKDGILCATCPDCNDSPLAGDEKMERQYKLACEYNKIENPPKWNENSKCQLRMLVRWIEEFEKNEDGSYTWVVNPGICYLNCPKSSILDMKGMQVGTGYVPFLLSRGIKDYLPVVTAINISSRKSGKEGDKGSFTYSYETFTMEGKYDEIIKKCTNYEDLRDIGDAATQNLIMSTRSYRKSLAERQPGAQEALPPAPEQPKAVPKPIATAALPSKPVEQPKQAPAKPPVTTPAPAKAPAPAPAPAAPVPANASAEATKTTPMAMRIRIKTIYAQLPDGVKEIVMGVFKDQINTTSLDAIQDGDLKIALETLEEAQKESGLAPTPEQPSQEQAPEQPAAPAAPAPAAAAAKRKPW